jgi:glyoxylase-like metal-dependent hydrolase (beta-lactamase superfamily II)/ferredoxin
MNFEPPDPKIISMANPNKRVPENVPGDFFVDETCIDCDACRQIAPSVFGEARDTSFVRAQPTNSTERRFALQALLACPTGSIGCRNGVDPKSVMEDFPLLIENSVFYCGFNSPKSYGGNSYFIRDPGGNWLIDSPKFIAPLVHRLELLGGIRYIFLTHRDDIADARKYARHFGSRRIIHRAELSAQPDAEVVLKSDQPEELSPGFLAIPTPGHTEGHSCLLFDRFLFTGDHLAWDRDEKRLTAFRDYCWFSWTKQTESMDRLAKYPFEWILPGHGQRIHLSVADASREMRDLVNRMKAKS